MLHLLLTHPRLTQVQSTISITYRCKPYFLPLLLDSVIFLLSLSIRRQKLPLTMQQTVSSIVTSRNQSLIAAYLLLVKPSHYRPLSTETMQVNGNKPLSNHLHHHFSLTFDDREHPSFSFFNIVQTTLLTSHLLTTWIITVF